MAEGGLHGESNAVPDGGRYTAGRDHFAGAGEPDAGWIGATAQEDLPYKEGSWEGTTQKVNFVRYADDFIITGCSKELLEKEVKPLVERFMFERGLQLSPEKTCITHVEDGFDFLGQNLRWYGSKLLLTPSRKNMHAFLDKVRVAIRSNRAVKQEYLIRLLNPIIRGWAHYHRHIKAGKAFRKVRMILWNSLWRWAKRGHPNKSATWIVDRY